MSQDLWTEPVYQDKAILITRKTSDDDTSHIRIFKLKKSLFRSTTWKIVKGSIVHWLLERQANRGSGRIPITEKRFSQKCAHLLNLLDVIKPTMPPLSFPESDRADQHSSLHFSKAQDDEEWHKFQTHMSYMSYVEMESRKLPDRYY